MGETIFHQGDTTDSGLVMVVDGALGVYGAFDKDPFQTNSPTVIKSGSVQVYLMSLEFFMIIIIYYIYNVIIYYH